LKPRPSSPVWFVIGADADVEGSRDDVEEVLNVHADRLGRAARGLDFQHELGKIGSEARRRQKTHSR
jgi:hypothetical protein